MKLYMMIVSSYPSIAVGMAPPIVGKSGKYSFGKTGETDIECFGIMKNDEPELYHYLTNKFNIPDSDTGFIEVEL